MGQPKRKEPTSIKQEAHRLVDQLPENASWKDLVYAIHVRLAIEQGLKDSRAGRVKSQEEIERKYGIRE